jgi:pimeloyl-ACP methyl ester carboxylesterase
MRDGSPVILVPGAVGQDFVYWNVSQRYLENAGHPTYTLTFPRLSFGDHRESAEMLEQKVKDVKTSEEADVVHLIGHSIGGLVSRYYLKFLGGSRHVGHLVCLGTPHEGTWAAWAGAFLKGARMIRPGSPFIETLKNGGPDGVPVTNIAARFDSMVVPWDAAILEADDAENHVLRLGNHWSLLWSRKVHDWIIDALEEQDQASAGENVGGSAPAGATG